MQHLADLCEGRQVLTCMIGSVLPYAAYIMNACACCGATKQSSTNQGRQVMSFMCCLPSNAYQSNPCMMLLTDASVHGMSHDEVRCVHACRFHFLAIDRPTHFLIMQQMLATGERLLR